VERGSACTANKIEGGHSTIGPLPSHVDPIRRFWNWISGRLDSETVKLESLSEVDEKGLGQHTTKF